MLNRIKIIIQLIRVKQWTKNLICFAGDIFTNQISYNEYFNLSFYTFVCFSLISSSVYIFNDIIDKKADLNHYKKKLRPIASGKVSTPYAISIAIIFICAGLYISYTFSKSIFFVLLFYLLNNFLYTKYFKSLPILDVFSIAFGFILRLIAGIYAVNDIPTPWIVLCTMFLALFLGFSKRKSEKSSLKNDTKHKNHQRPVLLKYEEGILEMLVNETSFGAVIAYSLFTISSGKNESLIFTVPIVYIAITHYKMTVFKNNKYGEEPESVLLTDKTIQIFILFWIITYYFITKLNISLF